MGLLTGDGPKLNIVPLDGVSQGMISDMGHRAAGSDAEIANVANHGIADRGQAMMGSDQQSAQSAASSAQDPNMVQAIRNQYQAQAGRGIQDIVNKNRLNAPIHRAALLDQASGAAQAAGEIETSNYQALTQANLDYEQARAQALNSILTSVGMGVGMVAGSRRPPSVRPHTQSDEMFNGTGREESPMDGGMGAMAGMIG